MYVTSSIELSLLERLLSPNPDSSGALRRSAGSGRHLSSLVRGTYLSLYRRFCRLTTMPRFEEMAHSTTGETLF